MEALFQTVHKSLVRLQMRKLLIILIASFAVVFTARAQFSDSQTGLLQMPTAEMQDEGTFMITNGLLNAASLPTSGWDYKTFAYGFNITFWKRLDVSYICTIFDGKRRSNPSDRDMIMFNQDRHFAARFQLLREGEFGYKWLPAVLVGVSDPFTGSTDYEYIGSDVSGSGNGYFNRYYIAMTRHFETGWGRVGAHLAYQYNRRSDYPLNGPCAGVDWQVKWLSVGSVLDSVRLIAEYDSRTINAGLVASFWENRFEAMVEWQNVGGMVHKFGTGLNFGLRYKLRLKGLY